MGLRTNQDKLVKIAVYGEVSAPTLPPTMYRADSVGQSVVMIGMYGIAYNARVGDLAFGWAADHLEPGVSIHNLDQQMHMALHYMTCVGNEAMVISGDATGAKGRLSGEHERLLVDFEPTVLEKLCVGDKIQIMGHGVGLELLDYPGIGVYKCDPALIQAIPFEEANGKLRVPVTHIIPPHLMGSGAELPTEFVDQDFMSNDRAAIAEIGLEDLRIGDLVAVMDQTHFYWRGYTPGAVTIGLINHGDSIMIGHGPGVMTLLTCSDPLIEPVIDPNANIANYLKFGNWPPRNFAE
jgi:hypothetical protein